MFYQSSLPDSKRGNLVSALVSLTPSESKRLIAKGVAALPEIKRAKEKGLIIIARGTTNTFVAEEIMGIKIEPKSGYCRGCVVDGELRANMKRGGGNDFVLRQGKVVDIRPQEALKEFTAGDVFIKGASAVDSSGQAGVLAANLQAGTVGYSMVTVIARGAHLIVPVGLEKVVPSVNQAAEKCGIFRYKYTTGLPCALIPLVNGKVVTEIQALAVLCSISATHVASGGIGGSEGTVVLALEGNEDNLEKAFELVKLIKGEPPVPSPEETTPQASSLNYDPLTLLKTLG